MWFGLDSLMNRMDIYEQCNPVRLAQSEPYLFQTQIEEYFYDLTT